MEENLEIIWTDEALEKLSDIYLYLRLKWSPKVADKFEHKIQVKLKSVSQHPNLGPSSDKREELRKILVTPHNYLLYQLEGSKLFVVNIIDTRQNSGNIDS